MPNAMTRITICRGTFSGRFEPIATRLPAAGGRRLDFDLSLAKYLPAASTARPSRPQIRPGCKGALRFLTLAS